MYQRPAVIITLLILLAGSGVAALAEVSGRNRADHGARNNPVGLPPNIKFEDFADYMRREGGMSDVSDEKMAEVFRKFRNWNKKGIALSMTTLFRSARAVVSDNQALINDPNKGEKGFTGDIVLKEAKFNFKMLTGFDIDKLDSSTLEAVLLRAEMESIVEVVDEAQDVINKKGLGFKNFLPAIFAARVAQRFKKKKGEVAELKLTAPSNYIP